jgi:hypothetical protein
MSKKYPNLGKTLRKLLFDRNMKPVDLARKVNLPPATIHRLITGKSARPYQSSLQPIAEYFSIAIEQLVGEESINNVVNANDLGQSLSTEKFFKVPLIPWTELDQIGYGKNFYRNIFVGAISKQGFATLMPDYSMEPLFSCGSILIFDPQTKPVDHSYVLVKLRGNGQYLFRQLLVDADQKYIKPLNQEIGSSGMRLLHPDDKVIACLIETRNNFQSNRDLYV